MLRKSVYLSLFLVLLSCAPHVFAQQAPTADNVVPSLVKFTGALSGVDGKPLTGSVGVTFSLYKEQTGGAPLWLETQNVQADKNGHYSVMLGAAGAHGLPPEVFVAGEARWLGVQASGQAEQSRTLLFSVPYALKALDAETLGGKPASAFMAASGSGNGSGQVRPQAEQPNEIACSSTTACKTGFVPLFATNGGSAQVTDSILTQSGSTVAIAGSQTATGNISAGGNITANGNLTAAGSVTAPTFYGQLYGQGASIQTAVSSSYAINAWETANDGSQTTGVSGATASSNGVGVLGYNSSSGNGVVGESTGGGTGVYGAGNVGVFGSGASFGFSTDSNAHQARTVGGWVKAMVYYSGMNTGRIVSCFNSTLGGTAATTPPCGFSATKNGTGDYTLDFGFEIDDRFFSVSNTNWFATTGLCTDWNGACSSGSWTPSQVEVFTFLPSYNSYSDTKFYLVVY